MGTQGSNSDRTGNGTRVLAPRLGPAYGRAVLGKVQLGSVCRRHRRIGRTRGRVGFTPVLRLLLRLRVRMVVRVGPGMGIRRMFPSLGRKLRHGPLCVGGRGRSRDAARGPIAEAYLRRTEGGLARRQNRTQPQVESRRSNTAPRMPEAGRSKKFPDDPESGLWSRPRGQSHEKKGAGSKQEARLDGHFGLAGHDEQPVGAVSQPT